MYEPTSQIVFRSLFIYDTWNHAVKSPSKSSTIMDACWVLMSRTMRIGVVVIVVDWSYSSRAEHKQTVVDEFNRTILRSPISSVSVKTADARCWWEWQDSEGPKSCETFSSTPENCAGCLMTAPWIGINDNTIENPKTLVSTKYMNVKNYAKFLQKWEWKLYNKLII